MVISKRYRLAIGLILASLCLPILNAESTKPTINLKYDVGTAPTLISDFKKDASILPTYMARFTVRWYFAPSDDPNISEILNTPAGKTLSDLQQKFLRDNQDNWLWSHDLDSLYDYEIMGFVGLEVKQRHKSYNVYAVSKEDAFKMAAALVDFIATKGTEKARLGRQHHIEKLLDRQKQLRAMIEKAKEETTAKDSELESTRQKYEQAVKDSFYSLQRVGDVPNELRKTILEMDRMLNVINIEIVGITSKIAAIKKHSKQEKTLGRGTLVMALKEMEIREEIELAGAESRRQAILNVKERQEGLYDLYVKSLTLKDESDDLAKSIKQEEYNLKMIEKELARWELGEPLFVVDNNNMVLIRPLRIE